MKTVNLMPWCNLFLSESKYNITVHQSRYGIMLYTGVSITALMLFLLYFTYAYHLALAIASALVVFLGFYLAKARKKVVISSFELDSLGRCTFDGNNYFQLHKCSRFSFLGCWLQLKSSSTISGITQVGSVNNKGTNKDLFIFRDSVSQQDFSRITKVISQLNHQD